MKFFGVILFLLAMNWTWSLVHDAKSISEKVHISIQEDMKKIISDYISENLPTSHNLQFERFWTEKTKKNQVKATFVYSFEDANADVGEARVQVEGYAILNKTKDETENYETWSFDELQILDNKVEFKEALKITPGAFDKVESE
ncbi:MAG: hypothetical protein KDD34_04830 [Bdellovibrionales bacterium]|nr:hypothetical protein [Bdellovibrionales bacterium]